MWTYCPEKSLINDVVCMILFSYSFIHPSIFVWCIFLCIASLFHLPSPSLSSFFSVSLYINIIFFLSLFATQFFNLFVYDYHFSTCSSRHRAAWLVIFLSLFLFVVFRTHSIPNVTINWRRTEMNQCQTAFMSEYRTARRTINENDFATRWRISWQNRAPKKTEKHTDI